MSRAVQRPFWAHRDGGIIVGRPLDPVMPTAPFGADPDLWAAACDRAYTSGAITGAVIRYPPGPTFDEVVEVYARMEVEAAAPDPLAWFDEWRRARPPLRHFRGAI